MSIMINSTNLNTGYTPDPAISSYTENNGKSGEGKTVSGLSQQSPEDSVNISDDARAIKEKKQVEELKKVDREVQMHEAAHQAAAGEFFRGKSFSYRVGPDGIRYAVSGDVQVDTSIIPSDPKATIRKMERIRRAALAPGDPSAQDMAVAASASKAIAAAQDEINKKPILNADGQKKIPLPFENPGLQSSESDTSKEKNLPVTTHMQISMLFNNAGQLMSPKNNKIDISL